MLQLVRQIYLYTDLSGEFTLWLKYVRSLSLKDGFNSTIIGII